MYYRYKYYDDFLEPLYRFLTSMVQVKNKREFYKIMELYRFSTNSQVRDALVDEGIDCVSLDEEYFVSAEVNDKVHKFGCFVRNKNGNMLQVVGDIDMDSRDRTRLYQAIPTMNVELKYISPYNYDVLTNGEVMEKENAIPRVYLYRMILECVKNKYSDLHINNGTLADGTVDWFVEYRKGNKLIPSDFFINKQLARLVIESCLEGTTSQVSDLDDVRGVSETGFNIMDTGVNLRIQTLGSIHGAVLTIRIQTASTTSFKIDELGFDKKTNDLLKRLSVLENGFTFVTGPVRSGKNTTIFAVINEMLPRPIKIMDFSAPIETQMPFLQFDHRSDEKILHGFIKASKKMDADVIHINELPNKEIAQATFDLVNSSIGVFTTMHIDRIWHFPYKLYEYFGDDYRNVIPQINAVITQRAFVRQCKHCQGGSKTISERDFDGRIVKFLQDNKIDRYKESSGCPQCNGTGLQPGIRPLTEFIEFTKEVKAKLLGCQTLREMEEFIKGYVGNSSQSLDYQVCVHLETGELHPRDVFKIL